MPFILVLKEPSVTIVMQGDLNENEKNYLREHLGEMIEGKAIDGQDILVPVDKGKSIAYIKAISKEQYEEMVAKKKESSRILRPAMIIPGGKVRKN